MRTRLLAAAVACGALALPHAAQAGRTPVLDGKKVKALTATFTPKAQVHDQEFVSGGDRVNCASDRCGTIPFVFQPAKGVKGDLVFTISWGASGSDFDLYAVEYAKNGSAGQIATCGAFAGTSEKVVVPSSDLRPGKKYGLLVNYYRVTSDKVTASVTFPGTTTTTTLPTDSAQAEGCGL